MSINDMDVTSTTSSARDKVTALARAASGGLIETQAAAKAWGVSPAVATSRLWRLVKGGWLVPAQKGLFAILPLEARSGTAQTVEDPWVLASRLFAPCYVGGWSAAEHWGLTEQIFRSTFVVSAGPVRSSSSTALGAEFRTVRASAERVASVGEIWRGSVRVAVSDRERTLADGFTHPSWVGGISHLAEMLMTYRRSAEWSPTKLIAAMEQHPKGAAFKRLGYLVERVLGGDEALVESAIAHRSAGAIRLDPRIARKGKLLRRWGLWVNVDLKQTDEGGA